MKAIVSIARVLVGVLFIFSGLVKANDPLGLSYKMQEFFEIWGMHQFNSWSLLLSVLMNAFEIIAGFALLLGWRIKLFSWLLLLLIVFFTFLTGYTYITGNPKNCGCFGDCLPITSKTSFLKDVALTILIGFLLWQQKHIRPLFSEKVSTISMLGVTIFSFGFQWYTLTYLPVVDCLPFKKGNNITEKMQMPANAIPDSTVITFMYVKNGTKV
ncbi:MAG: DoxX family protein, partial [Chitinophagaceae bacterium]|nr:DoxX family protein [Chitinophagaceae bacterium]